MMMGSWKASPTSSAVMILRTDSESGWARLESLYPDGAVLDFLKKGTEGDAGKGFRRHSAGHGHLQMP